LELYTVTLPKLFCPSLLRKWISDLIVNSIPRNEGEVKSAHQSPPSICSAPCNVCLLPRWPTPSPPAYIPGPSLSNWQRRVRLSNCWALPSPPPPPPPPPPRPATLPTFFKHAQLASATHIVRGEENQRTPCHNGFASRSSSKACLSARLASKPLLMPRRALLPLAGLVLWAPVKSCLANRSSDRLSHDFPCNTAELKM